MEINSSKMNRVNNSIYDLYGDRWYTAFDDPVALLRAESKTKIPWILKKIDENGKAFSYSVLDIGCGAGFLSNALAKSGFHVTGLDASEDSVRVARKYDSTRTVRYITANAYTLPFSNSSFDIVTALDFLEHVEKPQEIIKEISRVLRPGGLFFYHTFNRNPLSHFLVIKCVEWFVKNTPKNMHVIDYFLKPKELENLCKESDLIVKEVVGLKPIFSSIPIKNYFTGIIPESLKFEVIKSTLISYLGVAIKKHSSDSTKFI